jgi:Xaa-Pro aminopeptidase
LDSLEQFRLALKNKNYPAFLITNTANVRWLTGFSGSFGAVLVTPEQAVLLTDSRYTVAASEQVHNMEVRTFGSPLTFLEFLAKQIESLNVSSLIFDEEQVTVGSFRKWQAGLEGVELVGGVDPSGDLRKIKTPQEIGYIREACHLADACLEYVVTLLKPGVTENALQLEVELFFRRNGSEASFPVIVVSGERSARPHGVPSDKPLEVGDFVTFDLGCRYNGYASDITRTFVIGKASERQKEIYAQVLKAEVSAIEALKPGVNGRDVDALSRRILDEKDLARYFGHGLGHGLGLLVHDSGRLTSTADEAIEEGQVWTVEPGVYIEGLGGVRIEDDVVITSNGTEILTHFPKELMEI